MVKAFEDQEFVIICAYWNGYAICLDADEKIYVMTHDEEYAEEGTAELKDYAIPVTALSYEEEMTVRGIVSAIPASTLDAILMGVDFDGVETV